MPRELSADAVIDRRSADGGLPRTAHPRPLVAYGIAVGATVAMLAVRAALDPVLGNKGPFLLFFFSVFIAATFGGLGPGLFATVTSGLVGLYFFVEPRHSIAMPTFAEQMWFSLFVIQGALVSALGESRVRVMARLGEFNQALEQRVRERTAEILANNQRLESEISTRERVEAERSQLLAVAEAANRLKDEFLATLSHELRTPLSAIVGWAGMLDEGGLEPAEVKHAVAVIKRNAAAQTTLVADLLDVSAIISGKLCLDVRRVDLRAVVQAAVDATRIAAGNKDIAVRVEGDDQVLCSGDPNRLQQVVWNLLSNAIKFTPRGGRVDVTVKRSENDAQVTVHDSGEGIPPEFLPYVFDRFRQANSSSTRAHGGLGLGLAIVRHLVELHGGTLAAQSQGEGQGAAFTVTLPVGSWLPESSARGALSLADEDAATGAPSLKGVRVLVVDDEADNLELVARLLQRQGAEVSVASSVEQALQLVRELRPRVLLSDIAMPGEDGFALLRKVRNLPDELGGNVRAAALTAYAGEQARHRILAAGYERHLSKPIAPPELVGVVADLAGRA